MSGYGPIKPPKTVNNPYKRDCDAIINSIIDLKNDDEVRARALEHRREKYGTFIEQYSGLPTETYKTLLIRILERFKTFTREQLQRISVWLFCWEEHALTGIMKVEPTEPIYESYVELLEKAFRKPIKYQDSNGDLDLANSTIVLIINEIVKPCQYGNRCYRIESNPLHAKWKHPPANVSAASANAAGSAAASAQGGRRRKTQYRKKTKASKRKTQKKSKKQRS